LGEVGADPDKSFPVCRARVVPGNGRATLRSPSK
jgi:hypothetical protein